MDSISHSTLAPCADCAFWHSDESSRGEYANGTCHFNPPIGSEDAIALVPVQVENPALLDLRRSLENATSFLEELQRLNRYPGNTGKCFDEIKAIQQEIRSVEEQVAAIRREIAEQDMFVIRSEQVTYKKGLWPTTLATDICGQWKPH